MSVDNYKFQVACLVLKQTLVFLLDQGLESYLEYSNWEKLSQNLAVNPKTFEQTKLEAREIYNKPDRKTVAFNEFWKIIVPNLSAICTNSEIDVIKKRLQNFIELKKSSTKMKIKEEYNSSSLSQIDLQQELAWIKSIVNSGDSDCLIKLWQKLQFCEDDRLRDALNSEISKLNDLSSNIIQNKNQPTTHFYEDIDLGGLNKNLVRDQLSVVSQLLNKGDQASLALVGLFVLHNDKALRDVVLEGLLVFDEEDLMVLLELMEVHSDFQYREAAIKIRQEIIKQETS